jgi:lipopolysaccharide/colanic/teichoic acid biosynthesis glycosyltransferase
MDSFQLVPYPTPKRILDRVLAALLLVLLGPLIVVALALLTLEMLVDPDARGGWLYRERRVSRGREFDLLKLRTLRADVLERVRARGEHAQLHELEAANLTRAGRLLKRFYLDELPQLWNVLRGDMSLVGPRPWPPAMVREQEREGLGYRRLVAAGWTGPAQVRKGVPGVRYADLDLAYVQACRTWSAWRLVRFDLSILRQTVRVLLRGEGLRY